MLSSYLILRMIAKEVKRANDDSETRGAALPHTAAAYAHIIILVTPQTADSPSL
jgi:hypothetical protein